MRSHAKASSVGSNSGQAEGLGSLRRPGTLAALVLALVVAACLIPGGALAAETRLQIGSFGPDGTDATQFGFPAALAVDQGTHDLYVADYGLGTIEKFDQDGVPTDFSALGSNEIGGFVLFGGEGLEQIAVNSTTHAFYVVDYGNSVIKAFQQDGEPLDFTAGPGAGSNELPEVAEACGVAVDANGLIYMGDYGAGIHIFKPNGEELTSFPVSEPCNLAVDGSGDVFVNHYFGGIEKFTPSEFPVTAATTYPVSGEVVDSETAKTVSIDPSNDDLYVNHSNHVSVFDSSGALRYQFGNALEFSEGVAVDGTTGKAYASDGGSLLVGIYGPPVPLPSISAEDADGITASTATLHATLDPEGKQLSDCHFEYISEALFQAREVQELTVSATGGTFSLSFGGQSTPAIRFDAPAGDVEAKLNALSTIALLTNGGNTNSGSVIVSGGPGNEAGSQPYTIAFHGVLANKDVEAITADASSLTGGAASAQVVTTQEGKAGSWAGASSAPCEPPAAAIPADSTVHAVKADISGLTAGTTYRFRLVAGTAEGSVDGAERTFATAMGLPTVNEQSVEAIGLTDATLSAKINPKGAKTTYHVEYGTTTSYGQSTLESAPVGFQSDDTAHAVRVHIGGLTAGTAYHFRFVATSPAGVTEGTDTAFATYPTSPGLAPCSNDRFRVGFGARLPDCRAYEQASPVDKHGANVIGHVAQVQSSLAGDRMTFYLTGGLPSSGGSSRLAAFMASRGQDGWSTDGLLPLLESDQVAYAPGWSDDLATTFVVGGAPGGAGYAIYLRDSGTGTFQLGPTSPQNTLTFAGPTAFAADTSHLIFEAEAVLLPGAVAGKNNLYELNHGTLTLPGRIPVAPATSCDDADGPVCVPAPDGARTRFGYSIHQEISRDGSKVIFTTYTAKQLYIREDGTKTTQISASQKTNGSGPGGTDPLGPKPAKFDAATPDGAHVFFTSPEELTNDANTGPGPALGRANINGTGANHSFIPTPAAATGVTVNGSHMYWANPTTNTIGRANLDGSGADQSFITGANNPQGVAVDGAHVYWASAASGVDGVGTIGRANLDGSGADQSFITGANNPQGVAVNGSFIYWANAGTTAATRAIGRANIDGTSPSQAFIAVSGSSGPAGVGVNTSFVYWTNPDLNSIGRATIAGASANQTFVSALNNPRGLALDGSFIYWANAGAMAAIGRANLDGSEANTTFLPTNGARDVAVDGSHVYWSAAVDARDTGNDLYHYDTESGELTDLTVSVAAPKGANVQGVLGATDDGSYVYFVSNSVLAPGVPGCPPSSECPINLYVAHAGTVTFIAQLSGTAQTGEDQKNWTPEYFGFPKSSFLAADGTLFFSSKRTLDLSGHDHGKGCANSTPCTEFYRYAPADEELSCVTCTLTGTPPTGSITLGPGPSFLHDGPRTQILNRNLSADGDRFFFETSDSLLPTDTNGVVDVYEWEARGSGSCESENQNGGCIYLISSGTSPDPSYFGDASANGDHVFIFTSQQLVPGDRDELVDLYDAGVGAGLASQHALAPPTCASAACQVNPAPPPDPPTSSATFSGPGNAHKPPVARKCPKGKRKVRRAGKVRCQKAHKAKQHKRHSNRGGSK